MTENESKAITKGEALKAYDEFLKKGGKPNSEEQDNLMIQAHQSGADFLDTQRIDIKYENSEQREKHLKNLISDSQSFPDYNPTGTLDGLQRHIQKLQDYADRLKDIRDEFNISE